ncbi:MAG: carotenoid biosynthesis protein [Chitinophagales bacterium]|nr:carotenoid biosynthesis protein [Chitinophagales bacterium]
MSYFQEINNKNWSTYAAIQIAIIYLVGILGICSPWRDYIILLTPINLLLTFFVTFYKHESKNQLFVFTILAIILITYSIEVVGVKTGKIFGSYFYGKTLGLKIFTVPPIIGVVWATLIYSTGVLLFQVKLQQKILFSVVGASIMTLLDVLIEPIAIRLDFWHWDNEQIPLQNYLAWWMISFIIFLLVPKHIFSSKNKLAVWCLVLQFLFFIFLNIFI